MDDIILHHYPPSPISEKVRIALGIKGLAWRSVEIPRLPPKPDVIPLTGGYRRTPIMQIGADIYCDSQCILRELERRYPAPSLHASATAGIDWGVARWTDALFDTAVRVSLATNLAQLPEAFVRDRARLFLGPEGDVAGLLPEVPHYAAQLRAQFGWLDDDLARSPGFLLGNAPGLADAACYCVVWFVRGRWQGGPALIAGFPALEAWEARMNAIGHGRSETMTSGEAIAIALAASTQTAERTDPGDPQGLAPGMRVAVVPDTDSGEEAVSGILRAVDRDSVALLREDPRVGQVCVHFPRAGYRVTAG